MAFRLGGQYDGKSIPEKHRKGECMMSELEQVQPKAPPERPSALNMFTVSPRDRFLAAGTVIWCFLAVDTVLYAWPWGMGFTAAVWGWYVLLGAVVGGISSAPGRAGSCWW